MTQGNLLKIQLFKNIGIVSSINYISKFATIVTGIVLARILSPSDFGIYGLAMSIMAFMLVFDQLGLKPAVIQKKTDDEEILFLTGFFLKSAISVILFIIIFVLIAPMSAKFYATPNLNKITIVLAVIMLIDNFRFIPETKIIKSNNFKKLIIPSIATNISYSILVILFALLGFRYWSFVYAKLLGSIFGIIAFFFSVPWKPLLVFNKEIGKDLLNFGKYILLGGLLSMVIKQMDNLIVGRILGLTALGYYSIAYRWGSIFSLDIGKIINNVLYPINVKYQDNIQALEKIQTQSIKYAAIFIFPISLGFIMVCPEFVNAVLGEKWAPSIIPLQIFSVHGLFWALMKRGDIFVALGKPHISTLLACLFIPLLTILIFPMTKLMGIEGTALAVLMTFILINFIGVWILLEKYYHFNLKVIFSKIIIPLIASLVMLAFLGALKLWLYKAGYSQLTILAFSLLLGVIIYILCLSLLMRKEFKDLLNILMIPNTSMNTKFEKIISVL